MLTLNDGRKEMYQWDIGRIATIDVECAVVHFSNLKYGASLAVEVKNGEVAIPNKLLTSGEQIYCWAFVSDENGKYTKKEQALNVNKRAKPSDYVYTETETLTWKSLDERITELEKGGTGGSMTGATAETDGSEGLVPAPKAGEQEKFLRGDGTWGEVASGLSNDEKTLLMNILSSAVYTNDDVGTAMEQLENLFAGNPAIEYSVTYNLTDVTTDNDAATAKAGFPYTATISVADGLVLNTASFSVVMSGEDITDAVYKDGIISIPVVTGEIVITAEGVDSNI